MEKILNLSSKEATELIVDTSFKENVSTFLTEKSIEYAVINNSFFGKDWLPLQREVKKIQKNMPVIIFDAYFDCGHYGMKKMALMKEFPHSKLIVFFRVPGSVLDVRRPLL